MEALLEVSNLSIDIRRDGKLLSSVKDISFSVYPGETVGIMGESGSGKSLTALSIPALLGKDKQVSSGSILLRSGHTAVNLLTAPEKELEQIRGKEISMIFQEPYDSLNPLIKVGAQIEETLELHGEKDRELIKAGARELMMNLGLNDPGKIADTYPHRLSGGMCQRVMIALAIICRPRLLIADEPTTALDHETQNQILAIMKDINRSMGTSILLISHDPEVIRNLCGRLLVMYSGRILEEGPTEDIFAHPAHEYTRMLLHSIPGRINRSRPLVNIPGRIPSLEEGRPPGCPFHPRCGKALPECKDNLPPAKLIGANHKTHCILEDHTDG